MSRLLTATFENGELQVGTAGVAPVVNAAAALEGGYGLHIDSPGGSSMLQTNITGVMDRWYWARIAVRFASFPSTNISFIGPRVGSVLLGVAQVTPSGQLRLWDSVNSVQIGSAAQMVVGQTHVVELGWKVGTGAIDECALRLDGVLVASASGLTLSDSPVNQLRVGWLTVTAAVIDLDGLVINDDQGTLDNTWPGVAPIVSTTASLIGQAFLVPAAGSFTFTIPADVAVGDDLILSGGFNGFTANTFTSVTDSKGNVYNVVTAGQRGGAYWRYIIRSKITVPLVAGDTITMVIGGGNPSNLMVNFIRARGLADLSVTPTVVSFSGTVTALSQTYTLPSVPDRGLVVGSELIAAADDGGWTPSDGLISRPPTVMTGARSHIAQFGVIAGARSVTMGGTLVTTGITRSLGGVAFAPAVAPIVSTSTRRLLTGPLIDSKLVDPSLVGSLV